MTPFKVQHRWVSDDERYVIAILANGDLLLLDRYMGLTVDPPYEWRVRTLSMEIANADTADWATKVWGDS